MEKVEKGRILTDRGRPASTSEQKVAIFVAVITSFITTFTSSALNLSVPDIGGEFHVSAVLTGWIVTGFILVSAAFSVPLGRFADLTGRKRILVSGIGLFALCSLGCAFSWSFFSLMVFRLLQGFGAAMIFSTNIAMLVNAFSPKDRGKVIGLSTSATYIGLSTGPVLGGILNHQFGWHSIFILTAVMGLMVFVVAAKMLRENRREGNGEGQERSQGIDGLGENGEKNGIGWELGGVSTKNRISREERDLSGNLSYVLTLVLILYGFSSFSQGLHAYLCLVAGMVCFGFFIKHELKVPSPVLQIGMFRDNPAFFLSNLAALLNYAATFAISYLLSIYLQVVQGFDSQTAGLILICQPALMAFLSPYAGRLSDRKSPFVLASFGMGLCALALFWFSTLGTDSPLWMVIFGLILSGFGFGFFSSPNSNAIMSCVDKKDSGVASSLLATMRTVGQTSSMAMVTSIAAIRLGDHTFETASPGELVGMMHLAFVVCACICTVGIFISLKRTRS